MPAPVSHETEKSSSVEPGRAEGAGPSAAIEREVLEIVEQLATELGSLRAHGAAGLDDSLDRDLGIGSLERVELLLRVEKEFGVRLPDAVMAEAESPGDLVRAITSAAPVAPERVAAPAAPLLPGRAAPASCRTLTEALRWHAENDPERIHIFLRDEEGEEQPIRYGHLWTKAGEICAGLRERGIEAGETVALMLRTEEAFFTSFFGVLRVGAIPVPLYPPFRLDRIEEYAARQLGILQNARARLLLTFPGAERVAGLLRSRLSSLGEVTVVDRLARAGVEPPPVRLRAADSALIQYTSGSTGEPKGVLLTHANLLANIQGIGKAIGIRPDDVGVSWLPLYHDMGLIGSWLTALFFGVPIAILSPLAFLARPSRWLWTLHAHRGTVSPAPNFAFELAVGKIADEEIQGLDLGSWRLALNGSESVSADTIERFSRRFAPYGFRAESMCPVYGLAESSVALTLTTVGRGPRVDRVAREEFQRSRQALPAAPKEKTPLSFVSCGRPLPGHNVRIVDREGRLLADRVEGRVEFRGPSVTSGYFQNPQATRTAFHEGWMDSGDLGYWADGELFITGRRKDLIIKAGRNLYPQEVEEAVGDIAGIRKGCIAAFGISDPTIGTERLVVIAETREQQDGRREELRSAVVDRIVATLGIPPDVVLLCPPHSVLKTSSGKIRRGATRQAYLSGDLERGRRSTVVQWSRLLVQDLAARFRRLGSRVGLLFYGGYVAALLALTLPALWALLLVVSEGRPADRLVRLWCRVILFLAGCRPSVEGMDILRLREPAVLAVNHQSYLDAIVLLAAIPTDFRFVAKRELLSSPVISTVIRKVGHLTVERFDLSRSVADAQAVSEALHAGHSLLVFPEGTFVRTPGLLPFRLGAFKAAVESGRPVIPITIRGTREVLPPDDWLPRPGAIRIVVGAPIEPKEAGWQEMVRIRDLTRDEMVRTLAT